MINKSFYFRVNPFKGYLPGDRFYKNGQPFETGFYEQIVGKKLSQEYLKIKKSKGINEAFMAVQEQIRSNIKKFISEHPQKDKKVVPFYLDFNEDGIDCFVHRWNWQ